MNNDVFKLYGLNGGSLYSDKIVNESKIIPWVILSRPPEMKPLCRTFTMLELYVHTQHVHSEWHLSGLEALKTDRHDDDDVDTVEETAGFVAKENFLMNVKEKEIAEKRLSKLCYLKEN